jgi:pyridoxal phosphate enzyme (YggS family)
VSGERVAESSLKSVLAGRLVAVEERLASACARAGRRREAVRLLPVTKTVSAAVAGLLPELGYADLGESRPQELWRKAAALPPGVRWHLVGHLQRNKIERTLPLVHLIHSADSLRLLQALDEQAPKLNRPADVLLEFNASGEQNKHGFAPEQGPGLAAAVNALRYVRVLGLMTMAAFEENPERCRPTFAALRELAQRLGATLGPPHQMGQLSMGMSNDFEVAVEEGATLVRIGTALFEGLPGVGP